MPSRRLRATVILAAMALLVSAPLTARGEPVHLSLREAVKRAQTSNPDFRAFEARLAQQSAQVRIVLAGVLPNLSLTGTYVRSDEEVLLGESVVVSQNSFDSRGDLSVSLFRPRALGNYLVAREELSAARAGTVRAEQTLSLGVVELYLGALKAAALVETARDTVRRRDAFLNAATQRLDSGLGRRTEVRRAQLSLIEAQDELDRLETEHAVAGEALRVVLNLPAQTALVLAEENSAPELPAPPEGTDPLAFALDNRADVQALRLLRKRDDVAETFAWLRFLPDLELSSSLVQGVPSFRDPDGFSWQLQLRATLPLYDGGARYGNLDLEQATRDLRDAELDAAHRQVREALRAANLRLANLQRAHERARRSLELSRAYRSDTLQRLEAGLGTWLEVLDAEAQLSEAQLAVRAARYDVHLQKWRLVHASGGIQGALDSSS